MSVEPSASFKTYNLVAVIFTHAPDVDLTGIGSLRPSNGENRMIARKRTEAQGLLMPPIMNDLSLFS